MVLSLSLNDLGAFIWLVVAVAAYLLARKAERKYGLKEPQKRYEHA